MVKNTIQTWNLKLKYDRNKTQLTQNYEEIDWTNGLIKGFSFHSIKVETQNSSCEFSHVSFQNLNFWCSKDMEVSLEHDSIKRLKETTIQLVWSLENLKEDIFYEEREFE